MVACADVLIEDRSAWGDALGSHSDTCLDFHEVQDVLLNAWATAAELLPGAVGDLERMLWAGPPTTELRLSSERPDSTGVVPGLDSAVDLSPLGPAGRHSRQEMAVTITAAPVMGRQERQDLMRRALVHMAQSFGYIHADPETL
ncbi:hypothetical protein ABZ682_40755 [Streptomyces griseoviridis]|uniref:hypothetical protein n=1 Tax=Streptomyces TaxID=1883 RepID=UPI002475D6F5|nr:hypothetical protein [Streptomyces sp. MAA16]